MKKEEIKEFIEHMELLGDRWTEIQVEDVYGSNTLEEALNDRKVHLNEFMKILAGIIGQKEKCPAIGILSNSGTLSLYLQSTFGQVTCIADGIAGE